MLTNIHIFIFTTWLNSIDALKCYSCSSLSKYYCNRLNAVHYTYESTENDMKADCAPQFNACASIHWRPGAGDKGDMYLMRRCAYEPATNFCQSLVDLFQTMNSSKYKPEQNCRVCKGDLCNNYSVDRFFGSSQSIGASLILHIISNLLLILLPEFLY